MYHTFYTVFSIMAMLLAMTMNGYVILNIAIGTGIGKTILAHYNNTKNTKT